MIVFVSPGLMKNDQSIGRVGFHLTREEAIDLRDVLTDAINADVSEEPLKAWFSYGGVYGEADPLREEDDAQFQVIPPSPFKELEDNGTDDLTPG